MENKIYDICIIGAGPAGMTAAVYAGRAGKSVAIIDKNGFGGNIALSPKVENIPGFTSISGIDFATNLYEQMSNVETVEHIINEVALIKYSRGLFTVIFSDNTFVCGLAVIIASGAKHRELNLNTKDIYYCVTCDGPMFKGKNVIVVGSGNTGTTYALELATYCKNVYICDVTKDLCCESVLKDKILSKKNIFWKPECTISSVNNKDEKLTSITLSSGEALKVSAIFGAIGMVPQVSFAGNLVKTNDFNYIITDDCDTKYIPGLFAAGDCRESSLKQVTTACADGSIAAVKAVKFINNSININK